MDLLKSTLSIFMLLIKWPNCRRSSRKPLLLKLACCDSETGVHISPLLLLNVYCQRNSQWKGSKAQLPCCKYELQTPQFMQYTSLNNPTDSTAMLPGLTEYICPTTDVLHLLLNFILNKCTKNFLKRKALISVACMCEAGSSRQVFSQAFTFATRVFSNATKKSKWGKQNNKKYYQITAQVLLTSYFQALLWY